MRRADTWTEEEEEKDWNTEAEDWVNLQMKFDAAIAARDMAIALIIKATDKQG